MENNVRTRLKLFLDSQGISQVEFCNSLGVSPAYVSSIRRSVSPDKLIAMQNIYPQLNIEWLVTGEGSMLKEPKVQPIADTHIHGDNSQSGNINIGGADTSFMQDMIDQLKERVAELKESMSDWKTRCLNAEEQNKKLQDIIDEFNKEKLDK